MRIEKHGWSLAMLVAGILLTGGFFGCIGCSGYSAGSVEVKSGSTRTGNIELGVGNVAVGRDCRVEGKIVLTAGNVEVANGAVVTGDISVDHGNVRLAEAVAVAAVRVNNGVVELGSGTRIGGSVILANGLIEVQGATVEGVVKLKRGRLEVGPGSLLAAGLEVVNPGGVLQDSTYVVIGSGARLQGRIHTAGIVRLLVAADADVHEAEFEGNSPEIRE